jgi:hypothetical protein
LVEKTDNDPNAENEALRAFVGTLYSDLTLPPSFKRYDAQSLSSRSEFPEQAKYINSVGELDIHRHQQVYLYQIAHFLVKENVETAHHYIYREIAHKSRVCEKKCEYFSINAIKAPQKHV